MKLTKTGIVFEYHGDRITRRWPWSKLSADKYHSDLYSLYFNNFNTYWKHIGAIQTAFSKSGNKLEGFSYEEILGQWVRSNYPHESIVVLKDMNVEERDLSFWARIPKDKLEYIQKDVIVLRCGSKEKACEIVDSVESNFAEAFAFSGGILVSLNR
jgi:hypothetical protein